MKRNTVWLVVLMCAWFLPLAGHAQVQPTERVRSSGASGEIDAPDVAFRFSLQRRRSGVSHFRG